jgi:hypothetical protein
MAKTTINQPTTLINNPSSLEISLQEKIRENLAKAEALTTVALSEDFFEFQDYLLHDYLWALSDLIKRAIRFNEKALDILIKQNYPQEEK